MHEILKKRLMRKLEALPEAQLYQVLDYIEFLESKYAAGPASAPGGVQGFAERLEDRLRARRVMPEVMSGTMKVLGTAGRLVDGLSQAGRGIMEGVEAGLRPTEGERPASPPRPVPRPGAATHPGAASPPGGEPSRPRLEALRGGEEPAADAPPTDPEPEGRAEPSSS